MQDIFQISGLGHLYLEEPLNVSIKSNHRGHRSKFSWQELYTMDPLLAAKAWELAHYYGYSYPDVDFDSLTCLDYTPGCNMRRNVKMDQCPKGTHPYPTNMSSSNIISPPSAASHGFKGWVDSGCVEYRVPSLLQPYIGIRGLLGEDDLQNISRTLDNELFLLLNETTVSKRLLVNISASHMASSQSPPYGFCGHHFFILGLYFSVCIVLTRLCLNRRRRHKWQERGPRKRVFAKTRQAREQ